MDKIILYIVSIGLILLIACAIWPYANSYFIRSDLKKAALYGTKHSIEDTKIFLDKELEERRLNFNPEELHIEKDEYNTVLISLIYKDEISFLGIVLKELEFKLKEKEREAKGY